MKFYFWQVEGNTQREPFCTGILFSEYSKASKFGCYLLPETTGIAGVKNEYYIQSSPAA
jgi:hypothetical protein